MKNIENNTEKEKVFGYIKKNEEIIANYKICMGKSN
jgi:hypothetical protein